MSSPIFIKYQDGRSPLDALDDARKVHGKGGLVVVPASLWERIVPKDARNCAPDTDKKPEQLCLFDAV